MPQGRQSSFVETSKTSLLVLSGPKPKLGIVEQKNAFTGAFMALQICNGAESLTDGAPIKQILDSSLIKFSTNNNLNFTIFETVFTKINYMKIYTFGILTIFTMTNYLFAQQIFINEELE